MAAQIFERIHPRLRYFVKNLFVMSVTWLSVAGLVSMAKGLHQVPEPWFVVALVLGAGLAALFRDLPDPEGS